MSAYNSSIDTPPLNQCGQLFQCLLVGAFDLPLGIAEFFADVDQSPAFKIFHVANFSLDLGELCPLHKIQISLDRWNILELLTGHPLLVIQKTSAFLYGTGAVSDDAGTCGHIVCPFGV